VLANRRHGESLACANACAQALLSIKTSGLLVLDEGNRILQEYRRYIGRQDLIDRVRITPSDVKWFQEFPDSPELAGFDPSDRMFVAVALHHAQRPPILNATDRHWWNHKEALQAAGIRVEFLCPEQFQTD